MAMASSPGAIPGTPFPASVSPTRVTAHIVALPAFFTGLVMVGFIMWYLRDILVPFVVAFFLSYLVRPLANVATVPFAWLARRSCCSRCCSCYKRMLDRRQDAEAARRKKLGLPPATTYTDSDGEEVVDGLPDELQPCLGGLRHRGGRGGAADTDDDDHHHHHDAADDHDGAGRSRSPSNASAASVVPPYMVAHSRWERWLGVLLAALTVLGVLLLLCIIVAGAVQSFQTNHFSNFQRRAVELTESFVRNLNKFLHVNGDSLIKSVEKAEATLPMEFLRSVVVTAWGVVASLAMIVLFLVFLLLESPSKRQASHRLRAKIDGDVTKYIRAKTVVSATVGTLVWLVFELLSVKLAAFFGIITFLLNYIPTVGALVATLLSLPVVILDPDLSGTAMAFAIVLPLSVHMVAGNIVEPMLFGHLIILHPIVVLIAVGFWYILWGVPGAIVSVPVTAVLRQAFRRGSVDHPHPYAVAIQRLLEGDVEWVYGAGPSAGKAASGADGDAGDGAPGPETGAGASHGASASGHGTGGGARGADVV